MGFGQMITQLLISLNLQKRKFQASRDCENIYSLGTWWNLGLTVRLANEVEWGFRPFLTCILKVKELLANTGLTYHHSTLICFYYIVSAKADFLRAEILLFNTYIPEFVYNTYTQTMVYNKCQKNVTVTWIYRNKKKWSLKLEIRFCV